MPDFGGRPRYQRIADDLRSAILDGDLAAGDRLPSESELTREYGVSRIVATQAYSVLRNEGLIDSKPGSGSFVRPRPLLRRLTDERYTPRSGAPPFEADVAPTGRLATWESVTTRLAATTGIAKRLHLSGGNDVVMTEYRFFADDQPIQLSTSYEPWALIGGTPVEDPEQGEIQGVAARLASIGYPATEVTEEVTTRAARPFEVAALEIPLGVPVLLIERTHWRGDLPLETCDIIVPGDRYAVSHRIQLSRQ